MILANENLIPSFDMLGLPIHPWLAQLLMALTLALHWAFLAITTGGALAFIINKNSANEHENASAKTLSAIMPFSLSMAMTMGIAPLLFVQVLYPNFFYTANILMGKVWLGMLLLVVTNFYLLYIAWWRIKFQRSPRFVGLLVMLLMAATAKILSANGTLMQSPQVWESFAAAQGMKPYMGDSTYWARWIFALFALVSGGGLFLALYDLVRLNKKGLGSINNILQSVKISIVGLAGILVTGFLASRALPEQIRSSLLSSAESVFVITTMITFALSLVLAIAACVKFSSKKLILAALMYFMGLFSTAALRDTLRRIALADYFNLSEIAVHPQWSSFILFLLIFVAGLGLIAWIVKRTFLVKPQLELSS